MVLLPEHSECEEIENDSSLKSEIMTLIDETAIANEFSNTTLDKTASGEEYEVFCGKILEESGWEVTRTPKTGDHGVDLVAAKDNFRVCLQCKKYTKPVGNSAVQEITAGKTHYQGSHSGVVTNNSFTKKAIELAESNNVMLLHHDELDNLEKMLTEVNPQEKE